MITLEWRVVAPGDGPGISTSLTVAETEALRSLAAGKDVLEIGSAYGYSAIVMALVGARVVAVDPHRALNSLGSMAGNLAEYGVTDLVDVRAEASQSAMRDLLRQTRRFDLVWIDGDHAVTTVAHDVGLARVLLRSTGTLVCHDYDEATCPGVRQALDAWKVPPRLVDTMAIYGPGEW